MTPSVYACFKALNRKNLHDHRVVTLDARIRQQMDQFTRIASFVTIGTLIANVVSAQSWQNLNTSNTILEQNTATFLAFEPQGGLWTANELNGQEGMGLYHFAGGAWTRFDAADVPVLTNGVRSAAFDALGNAWFVVYNKGLLKFDGNEWIVLDTATSGIPSNKADVIKIDDQNSIWVGLNGYEDARLTRFDGTTWTTWGHDNGPFPVDYGCTWTMELFEGGLWLGQCHGLFRLDLTTLEWTDETGNLPHFQPQALLNDGMGNLWIGYYGGWTSGEDEGPFAITRFDGSTWQDYYPWTSNWVLSDAFAVEASGVVWCSSTSGLWYFDGSQWLEYGEPLPDLCGGPHRSVAIAPNGSIWWSAHGDGIWTTDATVFAGIDDVAATNPITISPNPTQDRLMLSGVEELLNAHVNVFDLTGARVLSTVARNGQVDVAELNSGAYVLVVGQGHYRFVKQ